MSETKQDWVGPVTLTGDDRELLAQIASAPYTTTFSNSYLIPRRLVVLGLVEGLKSRSTSRRNLWTITEHGAQWLIGAVPAGPGAPAAPTPATAPINPRAPKAPPPPPVTVEKESRAEQLAALRIRFGLQPKAEPEGGPKPKDSNQH